MNSGIVLVAAGLVLFSLLRKGNDAARLRILPKGFKLSGGKLYITVRAINATPSSYTIKSVVGDVLLKGRNVGTVSMLEKTVIAPNSETEFNFLVSAGVLGLLATLVDIVKNKPAASTILSGADVALTINVDNTPVDVKFSL